MTTTKETRMPSQAEYQHKPGTLGAALADPNSNISKRLAARSNFNPYETPCDVDALYATKKA